MYNLNHIIVIILIIPMYMHETTHYYILIGKVENLIRFQIGIQLECNFALSVSSNLNF